MAVLAQVASAYSPALEILLSINLLFITGFLLRRSQMSAAKIFGRSPRGIKKAPSVGNERGLCRGVVRYGGVNASNAMPCGEAGSMP